MGDAVHRVLNRLRVRMFVKKFFQNKSVHPASVAEDSPARFAAILWASEEGYADVVKSLITPVDKGNDEHQSESGENSPVEAAQPSTILRDTCAAALVKAADRGHVDVVRVLLSYGIRENVTGHCGWIALMIAAKKGHLDVFCKLLEADAGRAVVPESSWISMQFVSRSDDAALLAALADQALMRDLDVMASARVISWAAENGLLHAVQSLLASEKKMVSHGYGLKSNQYICIHKSSF